MIHCFGQNVAVHARERCRLCITSTDAWQRIGIPTAILHKHRHTAWMRLFELDLGKTGVVAIDAQTSQRGRVA
ncbi:MAG: hypothetical protein IPK32_16565 [Verrucomicrobiaceae bacterium]|nr:hypothetical protein [Verrucomicrobiaceae bacterium]